MKNSMKTNLLSMVILSILFFGCASTKKVAVSPYIGEWDYTFPTQEGGVMDVTMTINEAEGIYSGFLNSNIGSVNLDDLVIQDGNLSATFNVQGYVLSMKGNFNGDSFVGTTSIDGTDIPMNATRKQAAQK